MFLAHEQDVTARRGHAKQGGCVWGGVRCKHPHTFLRFVGILTKWVGKTS